MPNGLPDQYSQHPVSPCPTPTAGPMARQWVFAGWLIEFLSPASSQGSQLRHGCGQHRRERLMRSASNCAVTMASRQPNCWVSQKLAERRVRTRLRILGCQDHVNTNGDKLLHWCAALPRCLWLIRRPGPRNYRCRDHLRFSEPPCTTVHLPKLMSHQTAVAPHSKCDATEEN